MVALNTDTGKIVAVGVQAKQMIGRTPGSIVAVRPLKDGVIADFDVTERMLRYFIQKVHRHLHLAKPRLVVAVPSGITGVEQSAVKEAGHQAGARRVYIIEEPMAAAIGAGPPVYEPIGNMVVDVGGGTTEVAVISLGGIVTSESIRVGGDEMDKAIIVFAKKEYSPMLGERTAEEIKMAIGSACPSPDEPHAEIRGRDLVRGLPKTVVISGGRFGTRSPNRSAPSWTSSRPRSTSARPSSCGPGDRYPGRANRPRHKPGRPDRRLPRPQRPPDPALWRHRSRSPYTRLRRKYLTASACGALAHDRQAICGVLRPGSGAACGSARSGAACFLRYR